MIRIELFRANCKMCDRMEVVVRNLLPKNAEFIVHRAEECKDGSCCALAEKYGVNAVPTLVINGRVAVVGFDPQKVEEALKWAKY